MLCVAYIHLCLYIARYSSSTRRWVIVGSTGATSIMRLPWSWSVECDNFAELSSVEHRDRYLIKKWLVGKGSEILSKVFNDDVLPQEYLLSMAEKASMFPRTSRDLTYVPKCFGFAM